jgi:hypothetical protein
MNGAPSSRCGRGTSRWARSIYRPSPAACISEPFDFLTWFEFAEGDIGAFDELVGRLRDSEEWQFVDREVEVRLRRP